MNRSQSGETPIESQEDAADLPPGLAAMKEKADRACALRGRGPDTGELPKVSTAGAFQ